MTELIQKIAQDEALQQKIRNCKDAKEFATLMNLDEATAETLFPRVQNLLTRNELPEELLEDVTGGCSSSWAEGPFFKPSSPNDRG